MQVDKSLDVLLLEIFSQQTLLYAVLSSPREKAVKGKVSIRPITTSGKILYQLTSQEGPQAFHENLEAPDCRVFLSENIQQNYKQALICTSKADYHILVSQKQRITILQKPASRAKVSLSHNRQKQYVLEENKPISFLVKLGIMSSDGKVIAKKYDKFKQINRFLEMIRDILPHLDQKQELSIVDFGCGKAYLTFALYHYLVNELGRKINVHGLDLKREVIEECQELAEKLDYSNLSFAVGDIEHYTPEKKIDIVIALHACDTATDAAIAQAIAWDASVILCVPCCQHELFQQIHNPDIIPLLRHGILKERFAALVTDAARAQLLDIAGYQTQVLEFIDLEHTPKNLLIRAIKRQSPKSISQSVEEYKVFKQLLGVTPTLEKSIRF
ncbi:MAG: SAM-dependent methyltransferase [Parachlamydiaceae bacterium]|nr:SAM-dependent methyltransferase [Parachlamydiaceae bacterium]